MSFHCRRVTLSPNHMWASSWFSSSGAKPSSQDGAGVVDRPGLGLQPAERRASWAGTTPPISVNGYGPNMPSSARTRSTEVIRAANAFFRSAGDSCSVTA